MLYDVHGNIVNTNNYKSIVENSKGKDTIHIMKLLSLWCKNQKKYTKERFIDQAS